MFVPGVSAGGGFDSEKNWVKNFEIDVLHTVRGCEALMPHLEKSGQGSIVIIGSTNAVETFAAPMAYNAMKAALVTYGKQLSQFTGKKGVRVNTVSPGPIYFEGGAWEMIKGSQPKLYDWAIKQIPERPHGVGRGDRAGHRVRREPGGLADHRREHHRGQRLHQAGAAVAAAMSKATRRFPAAFQDAGLHARQAGEARGEPAHACAKRRRIRISAGSRSTIGATSRASSCSSNGSACGRRCGCSARAKLDLPEPGDYVVTEIGRESIIMVRQKDGRIRAFYNVCQHRGNRLRPCGSGSSGASLTFKCQYHHWEYELDGSYHRIPDLDTFPQGCPPHGMKEVRCDTLGQLRVVLHG